MTRAACPLQPASRKSRPRIIEAARRIACDEAAIPLTMEAIAASAGVTRRTLYNHFANVADVCMAACAPLIAHCVATLPSARADISATRARLHGIAQEVLEFQRDAVHLQLQRTAMLQALAAPALGQAYRQKVRIPLRQVVATRLGAPFHDRSAKDILVTLEAIGRVDYLVRDLAVSGVGSVVVDALLDRLGTCGSEQRRAA